MLRRATALLVGLFGAVVLLVAGWSVKAALSATDRPSAIALLLLASAPAVIGIVLVGSSGSVLRGSLRAARISQFLVVMAVVALLGGSVISVGVVAFLRRVPDIVVGSAPLLPESSRGVIYLAYAFYPEGGDIFMPIIVATVGVPPLIGLSFILSRYIRDRSVLSRVGV
jgi:hypothetical protein